MEGAPEIGEPDDISDVAEYQNYRPILRCAAIVACGLALLLQFALSALHAPWWAEIALVVVYATLPFAAFARWIWNKPAIRLPNGRVLGQRAARRYVLLGWGGACLLVLWQILTV